MAIPYSFLFEHLELQKLKEVRDGLNAMIDVEESTETLKQKSDIELAEMQKTMKKPEKIKKIQEEIDYRKENKLTMTKIVNPDGSTKEDWKTDGKSCRKDGPYHIERYPDASLKEERYSIESPDCFNRPENDGPALICYWPNGKKKSERYHNLSGYSRKNGPAFTIFDEKERPVEEKYYDEKGTCIKNVKTEYQC